MKDPNPKHWIRIALTLLALSTISSQPSTAFAQGTGFTYQGRLNNNGAPVNGTYSVEFTLFNTNTGGAPVAGPVTNAVTGVTNGLFTTTVDFGAGAFTGGSNWLEVGVRTNGSGGFLTLTPRQPVTPTPYAITAGNLAGAITVQNNTDGAPNIIGGSSLNYVTSGIEGATIAGGGAVNYFGTFTNSVTDIFGTVGGGNGNTAGGSSSTVSGGWDNTASGDNSIVSGGGHNIASSLFATIGGGTGNTASGQNSVVGGGEYNVASGIDSTVPGGKNNTASGRYSYACGERAQAIHDSSFVWNDGFDGNSFSSTAIGQFAVYAGGGVRLVGNVTTGDLSLSENGAYHNLSMSGGNSLGFIYGSYPKFQDFITMGYNYYWDNSGFPHNPNPGGGSSRVSVGYGEVIVAVGGTGAQPVTTRVDATLSGVTVSGTFNNNSDRNAKQNFAPVSSSQILDQVLRLPVSEWSYKDDATTRHIGPMAQDFSSVFNIGTDDKHIAPIDEGGVAFAAIQGLNQKLEAENAELKARLDKLEKLMNQKDGGAK